MSDVFFVAKIFIIGSGNFGTALAKSFSRNNKVHIYSIDQEAINNIQKHHENKRYLPGVILNNITCGSDIKEVKDYEIIIFAVPSQAVRSVANALEPYYNDQIIISTSKGLSNNGLLMTDIIEEALMCEKSKVVALSGPSIAQEVGEGLPVQVMLGGTNTVTKRLKLILENENFFIKRTTDKKGIQLLGFYKNIIALLIGICDGLNLGNNFRAALVAKAYSEFYYLNINKNIRRHSFVDNAGLGDLYVTATAPNSRNRRFGEMLAKGMSAESIKKDIGQVTEGYDNLLMLKNLEDKSYIDENLLNTLLKIIEGRSPEIIKSMLIKYLRTSDIKVIIFDWGNVLTQGNYSQRVAGLLSKKYGMDAKELFVRLERHEREALLGNETFIKYYSRIKKDYQKIKYSFFLSAYKRSVTWDDNIIDYCKELGKKYRLYILSNNYSIIAPLLKKSVLSKIFNGMIFSNDVHLIKPHREIFHYMIEKYKLRPENCLFVDDSRKNVKSAQFLKINTIEYKNLEQLKKEIIEKMIL